MKKAFLLLAILALAACSTLGLQKPPSVCDSIKPGDSVLCDLAGKFDLHLETAGDLFAIINLRAIKSGAYEAADALKVLDDIGHMLNAPVSPAGLRGLVLAYVSDYPELILLSPYLSYMDVPTPITGKDVDMLRWWIERNRRLLQ